MNKIILVMIIIGAALILSSYSEGAIYAVRNNGTAPVAIDGDLSAWADQPLYADNKKFIRMEDINKEIEDANVLIHAKRLSEAIQKLEHIVNNCNKRTIIEDVKHRLVHLYFANNDVDKAKKLGIELYHESNNYKIIEDIKELLTLISINEALHNSSLKHSVHPTENYKRINYIDLKWGDGISQIHYIEKLVGFNELKGGDLIHGGPTAFDITNNGDVVIFENNEGYVKIFDNKGNIKDYFIVEKAGQKDGYLFLDDQEYIWLHNSSSKSLKKYSVRGKLIENIQYEGMITTEVGKIDNTVYGWGHKIQIDESSRKNISGVVAFEAKVINIKHDGPSLKSYGKISGNIYKIQNMQNIIGKGLQSPSVTIYEKNGSFRNHIFSEVDPLYNLVFENEDDDGNVYFRLSYYEGRRLQAIYKYNEKLELAAVINNIPNNEGFVCTRKVVIKNNSDIYIMLQDRNGVHIIKYTK